MFVYYGGFLVFFRWRQRILVRLFLFGDLFVWGEGFWGLAYCGGLGLFLDCRDFEVLGLNLVPSQLRRFLTHSLVILLIRKIYGSLVNRPRNLRPLKLMVVTSRCNL